MPVREALKTLEVEGQVAYSPQRGYFVARLALEELLEVYRIRDILEAEAVRQAVPRMLPGDVDLLHTLVRTVEATSTPLDLERMLDANRRFHFTLYTASGMERLVRVIRSLWDATDRYRSIYYLDPAHRRTVNREHRAILHAVVRRDADAAVLGLQEHRRSTIRSMRLLLENHDARRDER